MKKLLLSATVLMLMSIEVNAQIPNAGFEDWTTVGAYMDPNGYLTPNSITGSPTYPITRSTDHYPATVGSYSVRIENNAALVPNDGFGVMMQSNSDSLNDGPAPFFPITGHPTSLTGYYKFIPQNGDSLTIVIQLYLNGNTVAAGQLLSSTAQANWTSFNIPISFYTLADSASILIAAYNAGGPPPQYFPQGNSVLYVDNLNFDSLVSGISEIDEQVNVSIFPNPFSDELNVEVLSEEQVELIVYDLSLRQIFQKTFTNSTTLSTKEFTDGVYFYELKKDNHTFRNGKVIKD